MYLFMTRKIVKTKKIVSLVTDIYIEGGDFFYIFFTFYNFLLAVPSTEKKVKKIGKFLFRENHEILSFGIIVSSLLGEILIFVKNFNFYENLDFCP